MKYDKNSLIEYINSRHRNYNINICTVKSVSVNGLCIDIEFKNMEPQEGEEDVIAGYSINIKQYKNWARTRKLNKIINGIR